MRNVSRFGGAGAADSSTASTRAARGPCCNLCFSAESWSALPMASTSTAPSALLRTHPEIPSARASRSTNQRKPTPCTRPRTKYRRQLRVLTPDFLLNIPSAAREPCGLEQIVISRAVLQLVGLPPALPLRGSPVGISLRNCDRYARERYAPSAVSTRIFSPSFTKGGTCTTSPVSSLAGLVTLEAVALFKPGSVSITVISTVCGSSTPTGLPSKNSTLI